MESIYINCCGLDVHKKTVTACLITPKGKVIQTYGKMIADLYELVYWLKKVDCETVLPIFSI